MTVPFLYQSEPTWTITSAAFGLHNSGVEEKIWRDSHIVPFVASCLSGGILLLQAAVAIWYRPAGDASEDGLMKTTEDDNTRSRDLRSSIKNFIGSQGGNTIFVFKLARLLGSLTLFTLSVITVLNGRKAQENVRWESVFSAGNLAEVGIAVTYVRGNLLEPRKV
ncbi:hypothetical protein CVT26_014827 [Gymnopilus dilepis]|uniref:Uncharacterized protein n=1 Tax=Gymnopilus dilepis TaxID=231916 RepID=A0A409W3S9_9AGAR|nr:hypothetical protein CVT26_014827 [Gymnopilus dilepis]